MKKLILILIMTLSSCRPVFAEVRIDLKAIRTIESSDCKQMYNKKSGAIGCYQITPIVVEEWNNFHSEKYIPNDMLDRNISKRVADWYLNIRIPSMIRYYKKPVTVRNILIAYNYGIKHVKLGSLLPKETKEYIQKYYNLVGEEGGEK